MRKRDASWDNRGSPRVGRLVAAGALAAGTLVLASCTPHRVAITYKCPSVANRTVVVRTRRGAIGLPKIGATPSVLKLEQKCRVTS